MFNLNKLIYRFVLAVAIVTFAGSISAANFPKKPIQFIIPFGAGGGADIEGRLLASEMAKLLGVAIVPVNKPGGGGAVSYTHVKNAKPDGYTIGWNSTSILTTTNIGNVSFKHDALAHLGQVEFQPMPLAVKADARWNNLTEFAAFCKANPGKVKIANSGSGSSTHLAAIALANAMDLKLFICQSEPSVVMRRFCQVKPMR